jgi:hypothetical protein
MLNPAEIYARAIGEELEAGFRGMFGERFPEHASIIRATARLVLERISDSDALYHDAHHTASVALVGQAILRGKALVEQVTAEDWLHVTVALLCHDIGYLRGVCPGDREGVYVTDAEGGTVEAPRGASDAFLTPYHIERSKLFVRNRASTIAALDGERLARAIELTRFPVPAGDEHAATDTEAALVRAADLIGQLGDPLYPRRLNALYAEFVEIGMAAQLGYETPADLAERYPSFFWSRVEPHLGHAIGHLHRTLAGKQWIAQLYANVFVEEHLRRRSGPERAAGGRIDGPETPPRPATAT